SDSVLRVIRLDDRSARTGLVPLATPEFIRGESTLPLGAGPSPAELTNPDSADWLYHTATFSGTRYSRLSQLAPANVGRLAVACVFQVGSSETFQTGPLVYRGAMYLTTVRQTELGWRLPALRRRARVALQHRAGPGRAGGGDLGEPQGSSSGRGGGLESARARSGQGRAVRRRHESHPRPRRASPAGDESLYQRPRGPRCPHGPAAVVRPATARRHTRLGPHAGLPPLSRDRRRSRAESDRHRGQGGRAHGTRSRYARTGLRSCDHHPP